MQYSGFAWLAGPVLGVWLYEHTQLVAAYSVSIAAAVLMLAYFWQLRLGADKVIRAAHTHPVNPLHAITRYLDQPWLRIAYGITLSRSCFWVALFVYGPIYVVESGLPAWVAGVLLSGVSGLLFLSPLVRRAADQFGTRQVIIVALVLTGLSTVALGALGAGAFRLRSCCESLASAPVIAGYADGLTIA